MASPASARSRAKALTDVNRALDPVLHSSSLHAGTHAADAAVPAIRSTLRSEGTGFAPPIEAKLDSTVDGAATPSADR